ncbi:family 78 glycoside hydrolase catalytic domain [Vibrio natriegens]|uniref:family 78 glycoside hydrolase catalytic domain n=1 Tax=Vibrio natriegens TaxID=691 RepID=UPI0022846819|nr:family 78 glycoside hydrolase catalytic domain [Vibrio natriegens]MCY9877077.1 family 78 glycoside hydrolase catalytic domain [Vibrio natriegens]
MNNLTVNGKSEAAVLDETPIKLRWHAGFTQSHFTIQVSQKNKTVYFKEMVSNESCYTIEKIELQKNHKYEVEVIVFGANGEERRLLSYFITGNFGQFEAKWITSKNSRVVDDDYYNYHRNPIIKTSVIISKSVDEAYINLVGLGYYNLYINGNKVSNYELNNDWTNYSKIIYYDTFDILNYLYEGDNEVLVELGNGWYNPSPLTLFGKYNLRRNLTTGEPKLLADIIIRGSGEEKITSTDESWLTAQGPYLFNNMYLGETVDLRLIKQTRGSNAYLDTSWDNAITTHGPEGVLKPSYIEKITRGRELTPVNVISTDNTRHIFDFGAMVSGFINLTFMGEDGASVELLYSEEINADGTLNTDSTLAGFVGKEVAEGVIVPGGEGAPVRADQRDKCICRDGLNEYTNQFVYHSFRYVEVTGLTLEQLHDIKAVYAHTNLAETGNFECSDKELTKLYQAAKITKLNNIHSVIEDCARERLAYGGDMVALAQSQAMMFDSAKLYEKTIEDFIADRMDNGGFPETAPFMGIQTKGTGDGAGPLGWQLAVPYLLKTHYQFYGDIELVKRVYPYLEEQLQHLNGIKLDEIANFCLGDWGSKVADKKNVKSGSPALSFTAACFYYYHLLLLVEFSSILGLTANEERYQKRVAELKATLIDVYRNDDGSYGDRSQTSYVFALYFKLEDNPASLIASLEELVISAGYDVECGIFGQSFFYQLANQYDFNHLVYPWLQSEAGIRHMLRDNSGALKEFFGDNHNGSCNHAMFSSYVSWLYNGLAGITVKEEACAANKVQIKPYFDRHVSQVKASFKSVQGEISCHWYREGESINLTIEIPHGLDLCELILPKSQTNSISGYLVKSLNEKHVYIDISDTKQLNLTLNTGLVCAKESC